VGTLFIVPLSYTSLIMFQERLRTRTGGLRRAAAPVPGVGAPGC
jgi:hypothetical protein